MGPNSGVVGIVQPKTHGSTDQRSCPSVTSEACTSVAPDCLATSAVMALSSIGKNAAPIEFVRRYREPVWALPFLG